MSNLWIDFYLNRSIKAQFDTFMNGVNRVFSSCDSIKLFNSEELQRLLCGDESESKYDFQVLRSATNTRVALAIVPQWLSGFGKSLKIGIPNFKGNCCNLLPVQIESQPWEYQLCHLRLAGLALRIMRNSRSPTLVLMNFVYGRIRQRKSLRRSFFWQSRNQKDLDSVSPIERGTSVCTQHKEIFFAIPNTFCCHRLLVHWRGGTPIAHPPLSLVCIPNDKTVNIFFFQTFTLEILCLVSRLYLLYQRWQLFLVMLLTL